ncbi:Pentatricopeptide repeat-containing protein At4g21300 [Linum grandiflorum]
MHKINFFRPRLSSSSVSGLFKASISSTSSFPSLSVSNQWEWSDESIVSRLEAVLQLCSGPSNLGQGKQIHAQLIIHGLLDAGLLGPKILGIYVLHDNFRDAVKMFYQIPLGYTMPWNWMIRGFNKLGCFDMAILFYFKMSACTVYPDKYTFPSIMKACCGLNNVVLGKLIHNDVLQMGFDLDMYMGSSLVKLYAENGNLQDARLLFSRMSKKDCVMWNVMLSSFARYGELGGVLKTFNEMRNSGVMPNAVTFACVLSVCNAEAMIAFGYAIHGLAVTYGLQFDPQVANTLVSMYSKSRQLIDARKMFDRMSENDLVKWNGMMSGLVQHGLMEDASNLFNEMISTGIKPDARTFATFLPSGAGLAALKLGQELHGNIMKNGLLKDNVHLESAVVDMYAKCGRLDLAHQSFRRMSVKDAVSWNSIITSCTQNSSPEEAIDLFRQMGREGHTYNRVSISAALSACSNLPALHYGKQIHSVLVKSAVDSDVFAESALIDMYAKCGYLEVAQRVFDNMATKNDVSWNSIIAAYANSGCLDKTLTLFHEMLDNGIRPDHVTFLAIISACAHTGQVDDGIRYFHYMTEVCGIPKKMEHYACVVDMFGRAGRVNEAFDFIKSMPFQPDAGIWGTLLGACRVYGNVELGKEASRYLLDLDPKNSGYYVLVANMHADASQWRSVRNIRTLMKDRGVNKVPGYSWVDVNHTTHMFVAADGSHPESTKIYSLLQNLLPELRKEGYAPQTYLPMHSHGFGSVNVG